MDEPKLAFALARREPPGLEVRVNFGVFAGRTVTPAEIEELGQWLLDEVDAVTIVVPERRVGLVRHGARCLVVSSYAGAWRALFPQHGPGRKHTRRIALASWQGGLAGHYPDALVRGLIQSDGCRHRRVVNGTNYPAYSFSNRSDDILGVFAWGCDLMGVRWRRANRSTISIARRRDVALLDHVMGVADV